MNPNKPSTSKQDIGNKSKRKALNQPTHQVRNGSSTDTPTHPMEDPKAQRMLELFLYGTGVLEPEEPCTSTQIRPSTSSQRFHASTAATSSESTSCSPSTSNQATRTQDNSPTPSGSSESPADPLLVPPAPIRKSLRIEEQKKPKTDEEDKGFISIQPRGIIPPTGTTHQPFQFEWSSPNLFEHIVNNRHGSTIKLPTNNKARIKIGRNYQADLPKWEGRRPQLRGGLREEEEDRDECYWRPPTDEDLKKVMTHSGRPEDLQHAFHGMLFSLFWRAVFRQFKGHIPMEYALRDLMRNHYNIPKSLETVEKCLEELPQQIKDMCVRQAQHLRALMNLTAKKGKFSRREVQEFAMRNYHLGEVQLHRYQFRRFYNYQKKVVGCNCDDILCAELHFVPRYACKNCTKELRDTTKYHRKDLCLLCSTYSQLMAKPSTTRPFQFIPLPRPIHSLTFTDEENEKVRKWSELEDKMRRKLSREEFEEIEREEKNERWRRFELTREEREMLFDEDGPVITEDQFANMVAKEKPKFLEKIVRRLQPIVLPHFTQCQCKKSGNIPRLSKNFEKKFNETDQVLFSRTIAKHNGNIDKVSADLRVEKGLVERFLTIHHKKHPIWNGIAVNKWYTFKRRINKTPLNLPTKIPHMKTLRIVEKNEKSKRKKKVVTQKGEEDETEEEFKSSEEDEKEEEVEEAEEAEVVEDVEVYVGEAEVADETRAEDLPGPSNAYERRGKGRPRKSEQREIVYRNDDSEDTEEEEDDDYNFYARPKKGAKIPPRERNMKRGAKKPKRLGAGETDDDEDYVA